MTTEFISSIEEIIEDQKNGKMVIMVDDESRENEGDLILPAEKIDDKAVNFMAKHGRGAKKGSIAVDGVSLTVNSTDSKSFSVNIVPYTWSHTNFYELKVNSLINVEVDMLARYVSQNLTQYKNDN